MVCNLKIRVQLSLLEVNYRGPQFRKAFHNLGGLRSLSSAPVMALTASAPAAIEAHVVSFLSMRTPVCVQNPLDRGNIYYSVMKKSSISVSDPTLLPFRTLCIDPSPPSPPPPPPPPPPSFYFPSYTSSRFIPFSVHNIIQQQCTHVQRDLSGLISKLQTCASPRDIPKTVIFCRRKDMVAVLYKHLRSCSKIPDSVSMFHASLTDETKKSIYSTFTSSSSTLRCLISSIAFGMVSTVSIIKHF